MYGIDSLFFLFRLFNDCLSFTFTFGGMAHININCWTESTLWIPRIQSFGASAFISECEFETRLSDLWRQFIVIYNWLLLLTIHMFPIQQNIDSTLILSTENHTTL